MSTSEGIESPPGRVIEQAATGLLGRIKKASGFASWILFTIFCLLFFTFIRIPNTKIESWVQGMLNGQLATQGITMRAEKSSLSFLFGLSYEMKDVQILVPNSENPLKVERVRFSPHLLPLFIGHFGAGLEVKDKDSLLNLEFTSAVNGKTISMVCTAKKFDLGKIGLLGLAFGVKGGALANGSVSLSGDLTNPGSLSGDVKLSLSRITLEDQTISMFKIPKLAISEAQADVQIKNGKAVIKTLILGKAGNTAEDIRGSITGDITAGRQLDASATNLKIRFGFSENATKAFPYLDALLKDGKQSDGMYLYQLSGPLYGPTWAPTTP